MSRAREIADLVGGTTPDIILKTSDGAILNLQTSDTTVTADSVLGEINFQAPDEASGTDSILIASKIQAVAEGTFSSSSNATSLVFTTANSAAAGTASGKMTFTSGGELILKDTDTADGSSPTITLQSGDTDIAADDVLGTINFQAPDEGAGTDAILVAAGIAAVSEGDFSSSNNETKLSFKTGASEAASEKMSLSSGGNLSLPTDADADDNTADSATGRFEVGASGDLTLYHNTNSYIVNKTGNLILHSETDDSDIIFTGEDGSSGITAATFDMSAAGAFLIGDLNEQTHGGRISQTVVSGDSGISIMCRSATDSHQGEITFMKTPATSGNYTATADGEALGTIKFRGVNTSAVSDIGAQISVVQNGTASGTVPADITFSTNETERMRINKDGNIGIGIAAPLRQLHINNTSANSEIAFTAATNGASSLLFGDGQSGTDVYRGYIQYQHSDDALLFATAAAERMRISSAGDVLIAKTVTSSSTAGARFTSGGSLELIRDGGQLLYVNRLTSDGTLISLAQGNSTEGTITVSGSTVSYNGGHLSRWSRLTSGNKDTSIVKGTVMTNLDKMVVWSHDAVAATYYEEGDELPEDVSVGDEKTPAVDAYTEDNEQLNCMAISSVEGDPNVAGVFVNWDDDDNFKDMNVAMTGDMVIRIAKGTTVARGDLLMSAGDGTAKPQDDDIVRSKTIAKVTSTNVSHTYDDDSYCVPCVLMAC